MAEGVPGHPPVRLLRSLPHDKGCKTRRKEETMICGNDPNANIGPDDRAWIEWFKTWLEWSVRKEGSEPVAPNGSKPWDEELDRRLGE